MHEYIKKLQTEALKFLLSEYFFFKYTFTRPISFLDQKSVRRSSNIFCIYSYVKFEPPSWPNPTPKIMIMSVKSSDYTCTCNRCVIVSQFTGSQSILKLLNLNYIIMLLQVSIFQTQSMLCDASRACWCLCLCA